MRDLYAARATRAYAAMQRCFYTRRGLYRRDGRLHLPRTAAHLWPFARALVATLDLAGIGEGLVDLDVESEVGERLQTLEGYWDPDRRPPAYSSDLHGSRLGGDRYYDDNAWAGLALVQHERMRRDAGYLPRAEQLFRFSVAGWASNETPNPGGVFWVEQGSGVGVKNHDRNAVSTAPNAELGLHIAELKGGPVMTDGQIGVQEMYEWVVATLDASQGTDAPGTGLFWDKVRSDGTIDRTLWSYNQGSMVAANVLFARRADAQLTCYLARAEAIARNALGHFAGRYGSQPPAFNAIFFRNLLLLHVATSDEVLRNEIVDAMRGYVDWAWAEMRDRRDRFHFPNGGVTLLGQSAMVQLLALVAWDPTAYGRLA
jgi:Glycosyl hydrolase family 76